MLKDEIRSLVAESLAVSSNAIGDSTSLTVDLGVDSIDILRLVTIIENRYGIEIDEGHIDLLDNLDSACRYIGTLIEKT